MTNALTWEIESLKIDLPCSSLSSRSQNYPKDGSYEAHVSKLADLLILLPRNTSDSLLLNLFIQNRRDVLLSEDVVQLKYLLPITISTTHRQHVILNTTRNTKMIQHNLPSIPPPKKIEGSIRTQDSVTQIDHLSVHDSDSGMVSPIVAAPQEGQSHLIETVASDTVHGDDNSNDRKHEINTLGSFESRLL
jgi:hypothetical protein